MMKVNLIIYIFLAAIHIFEILLAQNPIPFGSVHSYSSSSYFERKTNFFIDGQYITSSNVSTDFDCQMLCIRQPGCLSFNFGLEANEKGLYLCETYDITKNGVSGLIPTDSFDFYTVLSVSRSCSHAKSIGFDESRNYTINPDASGKAMTSQVFCDMRDKDGVGVTVVSHDSEARTLVWGCESAGCYRRDVNYYGISDVIAQLGALTKVSTHCEQYVKYECKGLAIWVRVNPPFAWLVSRDGRALRYWGGAPPDSKMCACGVERNCSGGGYCNCDENNINKWSEDSGLLTRKEDLPITVLRFGDVTSNEMGYHTLSKLRCYGQA